MSEEQKQTEVKEITTEELKAIVGDSIKTIVPELKTEIINELKPILAEGKAETKESKIAKAAQFVKDLYNGKLDQEKKSVDSTTGSFGYTVPTELASEILQKKDKIAKMRKLATVITMPGPFTIPVEGTGITAYWVTENSLITEASPTTSKKDLVDYYLAARVLLPRQLMNTSEYNIVDFISILFARAIVRQEETSFVNGSGSGQCTGFRAMTGHNVAAQAGSTLDYPDMVNVFYGLKEQYRQNGIWMTNAAGIKAIRKIKDTYGMPIFNVDNQTIFSKPLVESEDIPGNLQTAATATEIWFFDPSYYWIKDGDQLFADAIKVPSKLQLEMIVAEAIDGVYTLPAAAFQLQAVA